MSSMCLRPIEQTKIDCASKFFAEINKKYAQENVRYGVVNSFGKLMELVKKTGVRDTGPETKKAYAKNSRKPLFLLVGLP